MSRFAANRRAPQELHAPHPGRRRARVLRGVDLACGPANASCSPARRAPASRPWCAASTATIAPMPGGILVRHGGDEIDMVTRASSYHPRPAPPHDRLCQPVPARRAARAGARRRRRAAARARRRARGGARRAPRRMLDAAGHSAADVGPGAGRPSPAASSSASTSRAASSSAAADAARRADRRRSIPRTAAASWR